MRFGLLNFSTTVVGPLNILSMDDDCAEKGYYFVQEDRASLLASKRWQISRMFLSGIAGTILTSNSYPHFSQSLLLC
jgi:hypothetical protein